MSYTSSSIAAGSCPDVTRWAQAALKALIHPSLRLACTLQYALQDTIEKGELLA